MAHFDESGIRFQYPENWQLEREEHDSGWTVSVQSPQTAFFLITVNTEGPDAGQMAETVLEAMRAEYPDLEAEERLDSLAGQPAIGHEMRFLSLDLTNTCWTRSLYCAEGTALVMWQSNDLDLETTEPVLRAMCVSLEVDEE
jgi:hypothetical protein